MCGGADGEKGQGHARHFEEHVQRACGGKECGDSRH